MDKLDEIALDAHRGTRTVIHSRSGTPLAAVIPFGEFQALLGEHGNRMDTTLEGGADSHPLRHRETRKQRKQRAHDRKVVERAGERNLRSHNRRLNQVQQQNAKLKRQRDSRPGRMIVSDATPGLSTRFTPNFVPSPSQHRRWFG